jgi:hypothetical protein
MFRRAKEIDHWLVSKTILLLKNFFINKIIIINKNGTTYYVKETKI